MVTGLEAIGAASAIIQLISFARTLVSLSFNIYDGIPTAENKVEEYAAKMSVVAGCVQSRIQQVPQSTPEEKKLSAVAHSCIYAAEALNKEAQCITKRYQKGKVRKAVYAALRGNSHRKKVNDLNQSLGSCAEVLEIELLVKICDQGAAVKQQQSQGFQDLEIDIQNLITQLARGNTKIEGLLVQEAEITRNVISTNLTTKLRAHEDRTISEAQRQRLLRSLKSQEIRQSNPKTRILSHFFWKIGKETQNSIKGLVCSLLHDILSDDSGAIDRVLRQHTFCLTKDFYQEWSTEEAKEVLFFTLSTRPHLTCVFIDGLDELSDKDGFGRFLSIIEELKSGPNVKICVSSRSEIEIVRSLEAIGVQSLRLEDLIRPEMAVYVLGKLEPYSDQMPVSTLTEFMTELLRKAQGVFLWLVLATKSLTNGIENGDDEKTLSDRLHGLPSELQALYEAMWSRLNGDNAVYREIAAKYFRCLVSPGWSMETGI
ncbi:hypothetical protein FGRMN_5649 [Fusarium graminum]|nr:hypothetical protein FGRMN_5649 [Fusarium graminum]